MLKKDNEIWDKIKNLFKKEFDNEPVYKTVNISLYNVNFYGNKMSEENECYTCLSVILLYSIFFNSYTEIYRILSTNILKRMQICTEKKKIVNKINEELKLSESDYEYDDSYERTNEY